MALFDFSAVSPINPGKSESDTAARVEKDDKDEPLPATSLVECRTPFGHNLYITPQARPAGDDEGHSENMCELPVFLGDFTCKRLRSMKVRVGFSAQEVYGIF